VTILRLTYSRKSDRFQSVSVIGDARGIRDLYWQLTHNYKAQDGTEIGSIEVFDLDGINKTKEVMSNPFGAASHLSTVQD
jgi:hypothetical protein